MRGHNVNMIYLGNFADVDTDESNMNAGNAADLLGGCSAPSIADIQANGTNSNNNNIINDDHYNGATHVNECGSGLLQARHADHDAGRTRSCRAVAHRSECGHA